MTPQYSVILRAINDNQQKFDLELDNIPQFLLDISAIEAGEIGQVFGISSQNFTLPGTDTNNQFFNNLFDLGTGPAVGLTKTVPCQVLVNGASVYTGKLYVNSIITDQYYDVIYNCVVVNETIDFRARIDNRALADLDWTAYNHTYDWLNVSRSWNDQLFSGSILYPLAHYGKDPNNISGSQLEFGGGVFQCDNPNYPLLVTDFKPAIKVRTVLDTIFDTVGYRYQSNFITSSFFDSLYLLTTNTEFKGANINSTVTQSTYAYPSVGQLISANSIFETIEFNTEVYDNGNNYNPATYQYTADVSGSYLVNVVVPFSILGYTGNEPEREVTIQVVRNSQNVADYVRNLKSISTGTIGFNPFNVYMDAGDTLEVQIAFTGGPGSTEIFRVKPGINTFFKVQGPPGVVGATLNMGLQFPDDLKILDFINSLILKFNLVIEPVSGQKNLLKIEPFNDWVDQGTIVDWTNIVDRNVKWQIEHPAVGQNKNIIFTDKVDDDVINQYQLKTFKTVYGTSDYYSDSDLTKGTKKIETLFGATPVKVIPGAQTVAVPFLYKQEPNKYGQPFKFLPRLLFKQSLKTVEGTEARGISGSLFDLSQGYYYINDGTQTFPVNYYRTLGPNTTSPVDFNTGFDIHYDNLGYWPYQQNWINGKTNNDAYSRFWAYYINELYDVNTRLVTMNIVLQPNDIQNIKLNNKIFIDGHYYRINKITGANLIEEQSIQVELLKTLPRRLQFPRRRIYTNPTDFIDVIQNDFSENGTTSYSNFETGAAITSSIVLEQASTRDGNETVGGEVVWDIIKPIIFNPNVVTVGNVNYDDTSNNVLAVGNDVVIPQNTQNAAVLVPNRQLSEYNSDTVYMGAQVTQGRRATEYLTIPVYSGSNFSIQSSDKQYPYFLYTWNNASGSGTSFVELPDTTELDGVEYQFQLSSSFTGAQSITLVPSGSQVIDGAANTTLTVPGSLYQFKSVDGGWITTLAPVAAGALEVQQGDLVVDPVNNITFTGTGATVSGSGTTAFVNIPGVGDVSSYISIYSTASIGSFTASTPQTASFTTVDFSNNISLVSGSRLKISQSGVYDIQFSAQLDKTNSSNAVAYIWLSKNGTDIADTNTQITLGGGSNDKVVAAWNWFVSGSTNDYWEIRYAADDSNVIFPYDTPGSGLGPTVPSWIVTMNKII